MKRTKRKVIGRGGRVTLVISLLFVLFLANVDLVFGQDVKYPTKPIRLICAYGPGGATDIAARALASTIQEFLGQPVVVVNMPGAGGGIGFEDVKKSEPDGYRMLMASIGGNVILPALNPKLSFNYDDLVYIARTQINPNALIVNSKSPWKDFKEFADALKSNPGKYKFSTASVGGVQHLGPIILFRELGLKVAAASPVHFDSDNEAVLAVVRGDVDFYQGNFNATVASLKGGLVRCLAVTTPKRLDVLKEVPTFTELGYPNINIVGWRGVCGPPNTPGYVVKKWEEAVYKMVSSKAWLDIVTKLGDDPGYMNARDFKKFADEEFKIYRSIFVDLGMIGK